MLHELATETACSAARVVRPFMRPSDVAGFQMATQQGALAPAPPCIRKQPTAGARQASLLRMHALLWSPAVQPEELVGPPPGATNDDWLVVPRLVPPPV